MLTQGYFFTTCLVMFWGKYFLQKNFININLCHEFIIVIFNNFISLYIDCAGSPGCVVQVFSLVAASRGYSLAEVHPLIIAVASLVAKHRLQAQVLH